MIPPQVTRLVYGLLNAAINVAYYRYFVVDIVMYEILNFSLLLCLAKSLGGSPPKQQ